MESILILIRVIILNFLYYSKFFLFYRTSYESLSSSETFYFIFELWVQIFKMLLSFKRSHIQKRWLIYVFNKNCIIFFIIKFLFIFSYVQINFKVLIWFFRKNFMIFNCVYHFQTFIKLIIWYHVQKFKSINW